MDITKENFPAAFEAMDEAAKAFWAYPGPEWQEEFLCHWAVNRANAQLMQALGLQSPL